jgi:hypothetical protein
VESFCKRAFPPHGGTSGPWKLSMTPAGSDPGLAPGQPADPTQCPQPSLSNTVTQALLHHAGVCPAALPLSHCRDSTSHTLEHREENFTAGCPHACWRHTQAHPPESVEVIFTHCGWGDPYAHMLACGVGLCFVFVNNKPFVPGQGLVSSFLQHRLHSAQ